jgi:ribosomal protein L35
MANKSIKNRIKITKGGKIRRRVEGLGHNRSKWGSNRKYRKISEKELGIKGVKVKRLLNQ